MPVDWNEDDHALGYDVIDAGHRMVVDAVNHLDNRHCRTSDEVTGVLDAVEEHLRRQFQHEEAMMKLSRSPRLGEQRLQHNRFLKVLVSLRSQAAKGDDVTGDLRLNLGAFLLSHLRGLDHDEFSTLPSHCRWVA